VIAAAIQLTRLQTSSPRICARTNHCSSVEQPVCYIRRPHKALEFSHGTTLLSGMFCYCTVLRSKQQDVQKCCNPVWKIKHVLVNNRGMVQAIFVNSDHDVGLFGIEPRFNEHT
jgi:hypothetical protein